MSKKNKKSRGQKGNAGMLVEQSVLGPVTPNTRGATRLPEYIRASDEELMGALEVPSTPSLEDHLLDADDDDEGERAMQTILAGTREAEDDAEESDLEVDDVILNTACEAIEKGSALTLGDIVAWFDEAEVDDPRLSILRAIVSGDQDLTEYPIGHNNYLLLLETSGFADLVAEAREVVQVKDKSVATSDDVEVSAMLQEDDSRDDSQDDIADDPQDDTAGDALDDEQVAANIESGVSR